MELTFKKMKWNHVQVLVEYFTDENRDEVEVVTDCFPLEEMENEYFVELLKYFLSNGKTKYETWFEEFIYIPHTNGKPKTISDVGIRKIENGEVFIVDLNQ